MEWWCDVCCHREKGRLALVFRRELGSNADRAGLRRIGGKALQVFKRQWRIGSHRHGGRSSHKAGAKRGHHAVDCCRWHETCYATNESLAYIALFYGRFGETVNGGAAATVDRMAPFLLRPRWPVAGPGRMVPLGV
jgi:hypothetical protein